MTPILRRSLSSTMSVWGLALLTASGCRAPAGDLEPEKESDRNFVTDAGNKLDTGCIYRSSGPIEFDIDVTGGDRSAAALSRS